MKKSLVLFIAILMLSTSIFAQEKQPVQIAFGANRINDSIVHLIVKTTIDKGAQIFSVKKKRGG